MFTLGRFQSAPRQNYSGRRMPDRPHDRDGYVSIRAPRELLPGDAIVVRVSASAGSFNPRPGITSGAIPYFRRWNLTAILFQSAPRNYFRGDDCGEAQDRRLSCFNPRPGITSGAIPSMVSSRERSHRVSIRAPELLPVSDRPLRER